MIKLVDCFVMLMFYGKGNGKVLRALCIAMVTNHTKTLTMLITNMGKSVWMVKIGGMNAGHLLGIGIMGACCQAPRCCTWTMTNGNALCSLMNFVFQHVSLTRSYKVMYLW